MAQQDWKSFQLRTARYARKLQLSQRPPRPRKQARRFGAITKTRFLKALKDSGGVKTTIAKRLGCHLNTVIRLLKREDWGDVVEAYREESEIVADMAEQTIREVINQRDDIALASLNARWFLSRRGKDRGYGNEDSLKPRPRDKPIDPINVNISTEELNLLFGGKAS